jgi:pimeloyl-ACP methyl ester carboxylesterase
MRRNPLAAPMRVGLVLLLVPLLAGCFGSAPAPREVMPGDPGYDAATIAVEAVRVHSLNIPASDGVMLSTVVYEPLSGDAMPDGSAPRWPVVIFLHGWGFSKEMFQYLPMDEGEGERPVDVLQRFAQAGILAVAYDARGFARSGGEVTVAGPAEMNDLATVIDFVAGRFRTTGGVGLAGNSYGAGMAYLAWANEPRVTAVAAHQGWVDLYQGVAPGNVPKLEWLQVLFGLGAAASQGRVHPMLFDWYTQFYTRDDLPRVQREMAPRGVATAGGGIEQATKPLFVCQGMQETLLPQADMAWGGAGGFVRARVPMGGHSSVDADCWNMTLEWFKFFLLGIDTKVDEWPFLWTVDARTGDTRPVAYDTKPASADATWWLREGFLAAGPSPATFTIEQRLVSNPLHEPSVLLDVLGQPPSSIPSQFRQDPAAVTFKGDALEGLTILGAAQLHLRLANGTSPPFQVVATLAVENDLGRQQVLTQGAFAALGEEHVATGEVVVRLNWVKADLQPGDRLVLAVSANDPNTYMPLFADFDAVFTGESRLDVPFFASKTRPRAT